MHATSEIDGPTHPSSQTLSAFVHGRLDEQRSRAIESHLEECPSCCEALARLPTQADDFVQRLVTAVGATVPRAEAERETRPLNLASDDPTPSPQPLPTPHRIGRFDIRGHIGHGGFGMVFLAYDPKLRREVAVKVPRQGALLTSELRERFLREGQAAAALDHPHILPVFEAGEAENLCYIASAYCHGPNLADWLKQRTDPVPFRTAAWLVCQLASAVQHAHGRRVLHRDLKPSNVLLEPADSAGPSGGAEAHDFGFVPRISDFGLARLESDPHEVTQSHLVMGTASYMAPEQARGKPREIGPAVDIYALGAILYELLTGRPPFVSDSDLDTLQRVRDEEPVPPSRLRPKTPRDLDTICLKCLEKEPGRRYATAGALADDLRRFLAHQPIRARPVGRLAKTMRWCRRNPVVALLGGGLAAALVCIAVGSTVLSIRLSHEVRRAVAAEHQSKQHLWESYLARVQASRTSEMAGRRFSSLAVLREATRLATELNLDDAARRAMRDHAIACLALADLELDQTWPVAVRSFQPRWVSFDADLECYAFVESGGTIVVRHVGTAGSEWRLDMPSQPVNVLALSPDGRFVAAMPRVEEAAQVSLWNLSAPSPCAQTLDVARAAAFCFNTASSTLGLVDQDGGVWLYDLASGGVSRLGSVEVAPRGCAFDSQGTRLAIWGGSSVEILDVRDGQVIQRLLHSGNDQIQCAAFSPDGTWLVAGGSQHLAYAWHLREPVEFHILRGHQGWVTNVAFTPDGNLLATSSSDDTTRLWEYWTGRELVVGRGYGLHFDRHGRRLAGLVDAGVAVFRVADGAERKSFRGAAPSYEVHDADVSPDGRLLASYNHLGITLWDCQSGRHLLPLNLGQTCWVRFRRTPNGHEVDDRLGTRRRGPACRRRSQSWAGPGRRTAPDRCPERDRVRPRSRLEPQRQGAGIAQPTGFRGRHPSEHLPCGGADPPP